MFTKYGLPIFAVAGLTFAIYTVVQAAIPRPPSKPVAEPPVRTAATREIAGSGLVESRRENIPIGVNVPGVVIEVFVKKGDAVSKGDPLFRVDDRDLKAQIKVREAELAAYRAQYHKLKAAPRPEDVPPAEAAVEEARARLNDTEAAMARSERLYSRQMLAGGDWDKDRFAFYAAKATLSRALAELERIKRGTWKEDLDVAQASIDMAAAQLEGIKINLERLTVRAPLDGDILQLNVRLGQFAATTWKEPMIVLGDVKRLHVRVDIDENDVPLFDRNAEAFAYLKGRSTGAFPLTLEYVEPYVIPKQSLTGSNAERVDTRVLQVVYA
ncbi:MAG: biotin/lipoyl-binding protein, partial [Planctomycetia bacterium]|nr:biotin/lipoyl-binding protein [Planctomycetia bacterium]